MNNTIQSQIANFKQQYEANGPQNAAGVPRPKSSMSVGAGEQQIIDAAAKAWNAYRESPEGKVFLKRLPTMQLNEARLSVQELAGGPVFKVVQELLKIVNSDHFPIKSFSFGLNVQFEFLLGFNVTIGAAVGAGDSSSAEGATFLSLGVTEGAEAGVLIGAQFGLWRNTPQNLGGWSYGAELIVEDGTGIVVSAMFSKKGSENPANLQGITVDIPFGIDDGVAVEETYTFILGSSDGYLRPAYQPRKSHFLILTQLRCDNIAGGDGSHNEIYFTFQADGDTLYHYPTYDYFAMAEGDSWDCGRSVMFDSSIVITLWDEDDGPDDNLGTCTINIGDLSVGSTKTYSIHSKNGFDERQFYLDAQLLY